MSKSIPSPPGLPLIGNLLSVVGDEVPTRAIEKVADQYGPIIKLTLGGSEQIFVANHEMFQELMDEKRFWKMPGPALGALSDGMSAQGLFSAKSEHDPDWGQAHRILMPAFGPLAIRNMFDGRHRRLPSFFSSDSG